MDYLDLGILLLSGLYIIVSIVIELINIVFLLTPSEKDDSFGAKLLVKWEAASKYVKWFSVKTPLLLGLEYVLKLLVEIRKKLQEYVVKKQAKKSKL